MDVCYTPIHRQGMGPPELGVGIFKEAGLFVRKQTFGTDVVYCAIDVNCIYFKVFEQRGGVNKRWSQSPA